MRDLSQTEEIVATAGLFDAFNFDMMQAVVQEMNLYGETAPQVLKWLNVRPEFSSMSQFVVGSLVVDGAEIPEGVRQSTWLGNPLQSTVHMRYRPMEEEKHQSPKPQELLTKVFSGGDVFLDGNDGRKSVVFSPQDHLESVNPTLGIFTYFNPKYKARLVLQRKDKPGTMDFDKLKISSSGAETTA